MVERPACQRIDRRQQAAPRIRQGIIHAQQVAGGAVVISGFRRMPIRYQTPVLGIDAQGSAGARALPFCSNSTEIRSGERTKAI
ncbi:hypothetical protein GCM10011505_27290 [Tistrella bauzanensis]|uniref:Uncharacterized protein n=1 Tax=Tistrella bauzanensis TaxID=657419 RepID=A0ABQ1IJH6_9PROT|nr:hypothetical protein GCM10011505_27290 [Tistrella bauzanensis]